MSTRAYRFFTMVLGCTVVVVTAFGSRVEAQTCECNGDMWGVRAARCPIPPNGGLVDINDVLSAVECASGALDPGTPASRCPDAPAALKRCDANCDGEVNFCDVGQVVNLWLSGTSCDLPCGACCNDNPGLASCEISTENECINGLIVQNGSYNGDGTTCNPSPCDCQPNGVIDAQDIANATSFDVNNNGLPDECEAGGCCFILEAGICAGGPQIGQPCSSNNDCSGSTCPPVTLPSCTLLTQEECEAAPLNGVYFGPGTYCPEQNLAFIDEGDGTVFVHIIGPPVECVQPVQAMGAVAGGGCTGPPYNDFWVSSSDGSMCENFGTAENPPIPADFFAPGSDPFTGSICLRGVPLGITGAGDADTHILRSDDPFDKCTLPSATESTVDIEIVALSLESTDPITVTFNGGQNPESWDVTVDLSPSGSVPQSTLTATKTHCNGGTYTSELYVQPRFTFTKISDPNQQRVLDTGLEGINPILLNQNVNAPWIAEIDPDAVAMVDPCSKFHPGFTELLAITDCDCNENGLWDRCDIDTQFSPDCNANLRPDECEIADGIFEECELIVPLPPLPDPYSPGTLACGGGENYGMACQTCDAGTRVGLLCLDSTDCSSGNCIPDDSLCPGSTCGSTVAGGGAVTFTYPKSRFIGFSAPSDPSWVGQEVAIRVTLDNIGPNALCNSQVRYAGPPTQYCEGGACITMFWASQLQTTPHWMDWSTLSAVQLYGEKVVPGSRYVIQSVDISSSGDLTTESNFSSPGLIVDTAVWADIWIPYAGFTSASQPAISDVLKLVDKWLGHLEPRKSRSMLIPATLNVSSNVGIADVLKGVDAWLGTTYPFTVTCP